MTSLHQNADLRNIFIDALAYLSLAATKFKRIWEQIVQKGLGENANLERPLRMAFQEMSMAIGNIQRLQRVLGFTIIPRSQFGINMNEAFDRMGSAEAEIEHAILQVLNERQAAPIRDDLRILLALISSATGKLHDAAHQVGNQNQAMAPI